MAGALNGRFGEEKKRCRYRTLQWIKARGSGDQRDLPKIPTLHLPVFQIPYQSGLELRRMYNERKCGWQFKVHYPWMTPEPWVNIPIKNVLFHKFGVDNGSRVVSGLRLNTNSVYKSTLNFQMNPIRTKKTTSVKSKLQEQPTKYVLRNTTTGIFALRFKVRRRQ